MVSSRASGGVPVPDPKLGFEHSINTRGTMPKVCGFEDQGEKTEVLTCLQPPNSGLEPINTLGGHPKITYGKQSSSSKSYLKTPGSDRYVERYRYGLNSPEGVRTRVQGESSPAKRRRIHSPHGRISSKPRSNEPIVIPDEDDEIPGVSPRATRPLLPPPNITSKASAPRSNASSNTATGSRSGAQSATEFQSVNVMTDPTRKKSRKPRISTRNTSDFTSPGHERVLHVHSDDENVDSSENSRKSILQEFQQGVTGGARKQHNSIQQSRNVTSHHFRNARVNESTSDLPDQKTPVTEGNLRAHRRVPVTGELAQDQISNSSDELSRPHTHAVASQQNNEQRKPSQTANTGAKRKTTAKQTHHWPLVRARGIGQDWIEPEHEHHMFLLCSSESWRIVERSSNMKETVTLMSIEFQRIYKAQVGQEHRIRLEGRPSGSAHFVWDLFFKEPAHLPLFFEEHVKSLLQKIFPTKKE